MRSRLVPAGWAAARVRTACPQMWHIHWVQSKEPGWQALDQVIAKGREDESKSQGRNDMGPRMRGAEEHRAEGRGGRGLGETVLAELFSYRAFECHAHIGSCRQLWGLKLCSNVIQTRTRLPSMFPARSSCQSQNCPVSDRAVLATQPSQVNQHSAELTPRAPSSSQLSCQRRSLGGTLPP